MINIAWATDVLCYVGDRCVMLRGRQRCCVTWATDELCCVGDKCVVLRGRQTYCVAWPADVLCCVGGRCIVLRDRQICCVAFKNYGCAVSSFTYPEKILYPHLDRHALQAAVSITNLPVVYYLP